MTLLVEDMTTFEDFIKRGHHSGRNMGAEGSLKSRQKCKKMAGETVYSYGVSYVALKL